MNIVTDELDAALCSSLLLTCHQLHKETVSYFYSANAFLLVLNDPQFCPQEYYQGTKVLLKRLRSVQDLRLEIGNIWRTKEKGVDAEEHVHVAPPLMREQMGWFVETLESAGEGRSGQLMGTLVILDRVRSLGGNEIMPDVVRARRQMLMSMLQPLVERIRFIRIETIRDDEMHRVAQLEVPTVTVCLYRFWERR